MTKTQQHLYLYYGKFLVLEQNYGVDDGEFATDLHCATWSGVRSSGFLIRNIWSAGCVDGSPECDNASRLAAFAVELDGMLVPGKTGPPGPMRFPETAAASAAACAGSWSCPGWTPAAADWAKWFWTWSCCKIVGSGFVISMFKPYRRVKTMCESVSDICQWYDRGSGVVWYLSGLCFCHLLCDSRHGFEIQCRSYGVLNF